MPELKYQIYSDSESLKRFQVSSDCVGAIIWPAAQLSAYKLVTQIIEKLVDKGVNLQTETPVTKVTPLGDKWTVETPRGNITTSNIVHATNGYAEYLLPSFGNFIKATRGFMTAQAPPQSLLDPPLNRTYSFVYGAGEKFDCLIQQPPYAGKKLMFGGGLHQDPDRHTFDDAKIPDRIEHYLFNQLPKVLNWDGESGNQFCMCWCGIMGFSSDELPWVGAVSETIGGGEGQWICAGYTGDGILPGSVFNRIQEW